MFLVCFATHTPIHLPKPIENSPNDPNQKTPAAVSLSCSSRLQLLNRSRSLQFRPSFPPENPSYNLHLHTGMYSRNKKNAISSALPLCKIRGAPSPCG